MIDAGPETKGEYVRFVHFPLNSSRQLVLLDPERMVQHSVDRAL